MKFTRKFHGRPAEIECDIGKSFCVDQQIGEYPVVTGSIVDRLYEYEKFGYEPEQIEEIIRRYRAYRLAMNSLYGEWPKKNPYLPMIFKVADDEANANGSKIEKLHYIDEIHELPVEGPYHVFLNGIKDVAHLYPKMMLIGGRQNGKSTIDAWNYIKYDTEMTMRMLEKRKEKTMNAIPQIESVRFNKPATIVFWKDGTKTVVKAQPGEPYDPEKGIAMAIAKKALGNKGNYYNAIQKHLEGHEYEHEVVHVDMYIDVSNRAWRLECAALNVYNELLEIFHNSKATKADMSSAIAKAIGILEDTLGEDAE